MITSGHNFGQGFINGIGHKVSGVATAGREMARTAMDAVNDGFNAIGEGLDGMEFNPTVRPVMDWANVQGVDIASTTSPYMRGINNRGQNGYNQQSNQSTISQDSIDELTGVFQQVIEGQVTTASGDTYIVFNDRTMKLMSSEVQKVNSDVFDNKRRGVR